MRTEYPTQPLEAYTSLRETSLEALQAYRTEPRISNQILATGNPIFILIFVGPRRVHVVIKNERNCPFEDQ